MQFFLQRRTLRLSAVAIVVIGAAYVAYAFFTHEPPADEATFQEEYAVVLNDYNGKETRLEQFRGKMLLVYAWATWCPYCADELKNLATLKEIYGDRISIVAVNRAEPLVDVRPYTENLALNQNIEFLLDPNDSLYKEVGGYAMPEMLFINARGEIVHHQRGPVQMEEVSERIRQMLE